LILGNFQGSVLLDFGRVAVGSELTKQLTIELPVDARMATSRLVADAKDAGGVLDVGFDTLELERGMAREVDVVWRPAAPGRFRGTMLFRLDRRFRIQVVAVGEAVGTTAPAGSAGAVAAKAGAARGRSGNVGKENSAPMPEGKGAAGQGIDRRQLMLDYSAKSRLVLAAGSGSQREAAASPAGSSSNDGTAKAALLRKRLHDKDWAAKQAAAFTEWLNHTLLPASLDPTADNSAGGEVYTGGGGSSGAGTGALSSVEGGGRGAATPLKEVYAMRRAARLRRCAAQLYNGNEVATLAATLHAKLVDGTLALRSDRVLHADVGLSAALTDLLLSYDLEWLHLGLETVFGELIPIPAGGSAAAGGSSGGGSTGGGSTGGGSTGGGCGSSSDGRQMAAVLRAFVRDRVIRDPGLKQRFAPRSAVASGAAERQYNAALGRHAVECYLLLVLFLDRAKRNNLLPHRPCLFRVAATPGHPTSTASNGGGALIKSSEAMIRGLCQFLRGEGDLVRHLGKAGYAVPHRQTYIDEFDYRVVNLAVDLRDGVRLARLGEVLCCDGDKTPAAVTAGIAFGATAGQTGGAAGSAGLGLPGNAGASALPPRSALRVPAVSRLQKVHNTEVALGLLGRGGALAAMQAEAAAAAAAAGASFCGGAGIGAGGVGVAALARSVVDGCEQTTLRLLWAIIARHKLAALIDVSLLVAEVGAIVAAWQWRGTLKSCCGGGKGAVLVPASASIATVAGGPPLPMPDVIALEEAIAAKSAETALLSALLAWAQAVCHGYGVAVRNFCSSFADGRALCLLLHYYHPQILPLAEIRRTTAHLPRAGRGSGGGGGGDFAAAIDAGRATEAVCSAALADERANAAIARRCLRELGGVPPLLPPFDSLHPPEEKSVVLAVAYLCHRLVDTAADTRAAIRVQRQWRRKLRATGRGGLVGGETTASGSAREPLGLPCTPEAPRRQNVAAAAAPLGLRCMVLPRPAAPPQRPVSPPLRPAPLLQVLLTAAQARTAAATRLQLSWRGAAAREALRRRRAGRLQRRWYLSLQRQMAQLVAAQAAVRTLLARKRFGRARRAAIAIQAAGRGTAERQRWKSLLQSRSAAATIQAAYRGHAVRVQYRQLVVAAMTLQRAWRCCTERWGRQSAAIILQAWARAEAARRRLVALCSRAVQLQAAARGAAVRRELRQCRAAAVVIQCAARTAAARRLVQSERTAATLRGRAMRRRLRAKALAALSIQALARGAAARRRAGRMRKAATAATIVQATWRRRRASRVLAIRAAAAAAAAEEEAAAEGRRQEQAAACSVQIQWRAHAARAVCRRRLASVICLQTAARGALHRLRAAGTAVALQASWRGVAARRRFAVARRGAVRLQALARGGSARRTLRHQGTAAVAVQNAWRIFLARRVTAAQALLAVRIAAAVKIQRWYPARREGRHYQTMRAAAITVQWWLRHWMARRQLTAALQKGLAIRRAVGCLEAAWWRK
ncbi:unnamed protein product, partial [Phaeothamnion confervicola]